VNFIKINLSYTISKSFTKKIKSIKKNPEPPNQKELGPILRLASYNRKFVHTFEKGINELTALTKDKKGARNKIG